MPATIEDLIEAERRGILPPEMQADLDEGRKRGLIPTVKIDIRDAAQQGLDLSKEAFNKAASEASSLIPNIDFTTGINDFGFRADFSRADTPEEKALVVKKRFGPDSSIVTKTGQTLIKPEALNKAGLPNRGQPVLIDEIGLSKSDFADFAGETPAIAGAVAGGAIAGPLGVIPGIAAGVAGAMTGEAVSELIEAFKGNSLQSKGEVSLQILKEGALAGVGEGLVRGSIPIARKLLGPNTRIPFTAFGKRPPLESTVESRRLELVDKALELGAIPRIDQATGKNRLAGRAQALGETIFGRRVAVMNQNALFKERQKLINRIKRQAGVSSESIALSLRQQEKALTSTLERETAKIDSAISGQIKKLGKVIGPNGESAGAEVIGAIKRVKDAFSAEAKRLYGKVDNLVGGKKVVSSSKIKKAAKQILEDFPETKSGGRAFISQDTRQFLNGILDLEPQITFQQAQNVRSVLGEAAFNPQLLNNVSNHNAKILKQSVQDAIDASFLGKSFEARQALAFATKFYADNISKFDDVLVSRITRDLSQGGAIVPENIVRALSSTRSPTQINKIKNLVGDETVWQRVTREKFDDMVLDATNVSGEISGPLLFSQIKRMGKGFDAFFGKNAKEIRSLAEQLSARNGKLDLNILRQSGITTALKSSLKAQKELDVFLGDRFIDSLKRSGKDFADAIDFVFRPGNERQLFAAKQFFGENSPEWKRIQRDSLRKLLDNLVVKSDDPVTKVLSGKNLTEKLTTHKKALDILLGKDHANAIQEFADVAFLLTTKQKLSSGLVAANIALHPIKNLSRLGHIFVMAELFASKKAIQFFTRGFKAPRTRFVSENAARVTTQGMIQQIEDILTSFGPALNELIEKDE